jgi:exodeoxyribonuclease V beta subunit
MRQRLALAVRIEVEARKRAAAVMTYDDLLTRLRNTLADETRGAAACARLRGHYQVALVDEFQDTDPVQWDIMRMAFGTGGSTLVLIGDPKQAIYSFRGADVYAYLAAARQAGTQATLKINWRSDQALIDAYDALFRGVKLGHEGIAYRQVRAADANQTPRLIGAPFGAALRLRVVDRADGLVDLTPTGLVAVASAREHIADDLATDLVGLLSSAGCIETRNPDGSTARRQSIRPGHVAVLVRTHRQAALVRNALDRAGIPAVINGAGSVFGTRIAREWLRLLEALERPTSPARARSAALTVFVGWSAQQVAASDERAWEDLRVRLHRWAAVLRRRGVASLLETVTLTERLPGRILARTDGERQLTDLRHVGQLLHAEATAEQLGATALTAWLRQRIVEAGNDTDNEDRSRRLESDAEAVQVLTIHRSKGLEYPIVYYPYLWEPSYIPTAGPLPIFHNPDAGDERTINVGNGGPGFSRQLQQYMAEERGEDLRLTYVALTRAEHQAIVWWAGSVDSRHSSLSRLLFSRDADGNVAASGTRHLKDTEVIAHFEALRAAAPDCISVERSEGGDGSVWSGPPRPSADLRADRFLRVLDPCWRRTSYSAITSASHDARVASEPEESVVSDEAPPTSPRPPATDAAAQSGRSSVRELPSLLAATPGGVEVGTFIHSVLESADFAQADLRAELTRRVGEEQSRRQVDIGDPGALVAGLAAAIETPLGPLVDDLRLRDLARSDRLDELDFELPLVGGDTPTAELTTAAIGALLRKHLPAGDILAGYADRLDDPSLQPVLRGYLAGSIDLVLRTSPGRSGRFAIVDYKTNWLGVDGEELSAWHYRPAALADEMQRAHYPLQALLYTAALHRYLRWRVLGYDPRHHLAGILYLFVRGMGGAATPRVDGQTCGVFAWCPPAVLVEDLSDLLDGGDGS